MIKTAISIAYDENRYLFGKKVHDVRFTSDHPLYNCVGECDGLRIRFHTSELIFGDVPNDTWLLQFFFELKK